MHHTTLAAALLGSTLLATGALAAPGLPGFGLAAVASPAAAAPPPPPVLALLGQASASQPVEFDVILPLRNAPALDALLAAQADPTSPQFHQWIKPADFAARFGADPVTMTLAAAQLRLAGLQVVPQSRSLHVSGTAAQVNAALGATLAVAADPIGQQRLVSTQPLTLPPALAGVGAVVPAFKPTGFQARPMMHRSSGGYMHRSSGGYGGNGTGQSGYFYNDLKQAYGYPSYQATTGAGQRLDGTGARVAVVMSSDVQDSDIAATFEAVNFKAASGQSADPALAARRPVDGGAAFSASSEASEEATLDVAQVLGGAPGASVVLYDTPDLSDQSMVSAYVAIDNDNSVDVVSLSLGQCELYYTAQYNSGADQTAVLRTFSELFKQGNAQGITFVAASGDSGGLGCVSPSASGGGAGQFVAGVSVPAADPDVTAVGGTNLVTAPSATAPGSFYARENAWSDPQVAYDPTGQGTLVSGGVWGSGGGVSTLFGKPSWQSLVTTGSSSFRTVPDVAMHMGGCPDNAQAPCNGGNSAGDGSGNSERSSVEIVFAGQLEGVIGTSAAAPEMASAVALMVETQGRQGNLNPTLYTLAQRQAAGGASYFHQGVGGFNGVVSTSGSYNLATGNGTPDVATLIGLPNVARAGAPQSASNP